VLVYKVDHLGRLCRCYLVRPTPARFVSACLATTNRVGALRFGSGGLLAPPKQVYGFAKAHATARMKPPRRRSIGPNPTEASKPLPFLSRN